MKDRQLREEPRNRTRPLSPTLWFPVPTLFPVLERTRSAPACKYEHTDTLSEPV
jgi:hypothetical protein